MHTWSPYESPPRAVVERIAALMPSADAATAKDIPASYAGGAPRLLGWSTDGACAVAIRLRRRRTTAQGAASAQPRDVRVPGTARRRGSAGCGEGSRCGPGTYSTAGVRPRGCG